MKQIAILLLTGALLASCGGPSDSAETPAADSVAIDTLATAEETPADEYSEYETQYLAIVDTGKGYYMLDAKMYALNKSLHLPIDTMNRYYNVKKKNIVLPDDDEDELYRGEYFPRRGATDFLSLEYLSMYDTAAASETIALVAGIYTNASSADSMVSILRQQAPAAYALKARVYMGCMH